MNRTTLKVPRIVVTGNDDNDDDEEEENEEPATTINVESDGSESDNEIKRTNSLR
jgi:hypothetical protein